MKKRSGPPPDTRGKTGSETSQRKFGRMAPTPAGKKASAPQRKSGRGR